MEMKSMVLGLLLVTALALPALATASLEKDFISHETVQAVLKKVGGSNSMLDEQTISALTGKTVISNQVLAEALFEHSNNVGESKCWETCVAIPCISTVIGCFCKDYICVKNWGGIHA